MQVIALKKLLLAAYYNMQVEQKRNCFLKMRHRYLADSTLTLISKLLSLLAYGKHISLTASNLGNAY